MREANAAEIHQWILAAKTSVQKCENKSKYKHTVATEQDACTIVTYVAVSLSQVIAAYVHYEKGHNVPQYLVFNLQRMVVEALLSQNGRWHNTLSIYPTVAETVLKTDIDAILLHFL
jgi:hypothetical protein